MEEIKFVKYNKTRKEEFQLKTAIVEEDGRRRVEKTALKEDGKAHILSFQDKYEALSRQHLSVKPLATKISEDGMTASFPYVKGQTIQEILGEKITDKKAPVDAIKAALEQVFAVREECKKPFEPTTEFEMIFGNFYRGNDISYEVSNVDGLFENMLVTEDGIFCLDYEWVYFFPVPVRFLKFRVLKYFYETYHELMEYGSLVSFLREFQITGEEADTFNRMERRFQEYVHGENQKILLENFLADPKDVRQLERFDADLKRANEYIDQLKFQLDEKETHIRKIQEVQRLTNNHVTNLEIIIANLRAEAEQQGQLLAYLNRHESIISKMKRKVRQAVDKAFPKGTVKRKKLVYVKNALRHPAESFKLFTTEEGRNRIDGDFKIGEEYKIHGKLRFEKQENPMVSIVIPVYNQIHYTYLCLLSILEHTKDVSYEVIIADDVSTDATKELSNFAENLVICRNQTNQGFLRNCNQAAKAARGKYIMFLNNDTQVTEGWLSSLVNLIESDSSIGMVGSKLVYPDGRLQEAGGIIWSDGSGWNYGRLDDPEKPEYNYVKDVDYISGAAILLSVRLWKEIGGFDQRFAPAYCEDSDLAFEVRKAGYRVVYQPLSKVIHFEGISNGTDVQGTGLKRYQVENSRKLKEKWADEFAKQCENNGNPDPFRARERSMGKPMILVVDHYVPTYDRDAGSKTTFQYLKMFLKKGYVVKFLGDNYQHEEPYSTTLQQMGIEILYGTEYQVKIWDWLKAHGNDISVAYLNRPHIASKYIDFIKENTSMKIIYYGHDLHFLREGREYELTGDEKKREASVYWKSVETSLMHKADMSYYPSYVERDAIKAIDADIPVKDITAYVYEEFLDNIQEDFAKREGLLFVGGFAHPPNADAVLWFAKSIFPLIREKLDVNFYIVGSKVTEEIQALEQPGSGIVVKGFVSEEELERLYATCRIVVVPLRYGAGVKGKVVEAIYNGAPIVTTSVGAEGIPEVGDVLIVKDKPEEFASQVIELYKDTEKCRKMCQKTQQYIKDHFSIDAAWSVIEDDFR